MNPQKCVSSLCDTQQASSDSTSIFFFFQRAHVIFIVPIKGTCREQNILTNFTQKKEIVIKAKSTYSVNKKKQGFSNIVIPFKRKFNIIYTENIYFLF